MTDLHVRKIDFQFDRTVPFQWHPGRPKFGLMANAVGILAIAFEKFIVASTRKAIPLITDPAAAEEAEAFLRQEAQHAKNHRKHIAALVTQYPGLQEVVDTAVARYDELLATKPLKWQLAYTADLEATFTPIFKIMLDHEDELFRPGDDRVASLFLWHFVEEVEHRSSGLIVYDAVVPDRWYRTRVVRQVFSHVMSVYREILAGFEKHVPAHARGAGYANASPEGMRREETLTRIPGLRSRVDGPSALGSATRREMANMVYRLVLSQVPFHKPVNEPLPKLAAVWFARYDNGDDVTRFFGSPARAG